MKPVLQQTIQIKLTPPYLILGLLTSVSIACCAIVLLQPIALAIKLVIIALIVLSDVYYILRDALLLLPWSWQKLEVNHKGELIISNRRGQQFQPALDSNTLIHAACSILNFKRFEFKNGGLRLALPPVILLTNAENADELRKLRVWLRWFKHEKPHNQQDSQEDYSPVDLAA